MKELFNALKTNNTIESFFCAGNLLIFLEKNKNLKGLIGNVAKCDFYLPFLIECLKFNHILNKLSFGDKTSFFGLYFFGFLFFENNNINNNNFLFCSN